MKSGTSERSRDLVSGISVFFVAVPLCLGVAHASGAPLVAGLISGVIGGLVVGALSGSALSVSGPAAGLTTIVLAGISASGSYPAFLAAVVLAGLMQILLGALRAGAVSQLFPSPVITGMPASIGLILISKQFPHMVGYDHEWFGASDFHASHGPGGEDENTFTILAQTAQAFHLGAMLIGISSLAILYIWDRKKMHFTTRLPGSLIAVTFGILVNVLFNKVWPGLALHPEQLVQIPPLSADLFQFPDFQALKLSQTWILALTIAVVASLETLLSLEAIDRLDPHYRHSPPNRELLAQGIGNALAGLVGGLPVTSVVVRSSVNLTSGAASKASTMIHGFLLVLAVVLFGPIINSTPLACLASILVLTGFKLASPSLAKQMLGRGWTQALPFFITTLTVLFTDLLDGIAVGLIVSAAIILKNLHRGRGFTVEENGINRKIRFHQEVTFFNKAGLAQALRQLPAGATVELDATGSLTIDRDVVDVVEQFRIRASLKNIKVIVGGIELISSYSEKHQKALEESYQRLLASNRRWVQETTRHDPDFFKHHPPVPSPQFLFIYCSDCQLPAEKITGCEPGSLFVHRNVANLVSPHDVNLLSLLQYSVEILNIPHIVVCGHYGCSGIEAALDDKLVGLIENWVWPVKAMVKSHLEELRGIANPLAQKRRITELHILSQVANLKKIESVQRSLKKLGTPRLHAWVFDHETGLIKDLSPEIVEEVEPHQILA